MPHHLLLFFLKFLMINQNHRSHGYTIITLEDLVKFPGNSDGDLPFVYERVEVWLSVIDFSSLTSSLAIS